MPCLWDLKRRWSKKNARPRSVALVTSARAGSARRTSAKASSTEIEVWNEPCRSIESHGPTVPAAIVELIRQQPMYGRADAWIVETEVLCQ